MEEKIFVYGSYREGYFNHRELIKKRPDCFALAKGHELHYLPDDSDVPEPARREFHPEFGFPLLSPCAYGHQSCVFGEIYSLPIDVIRKLDEFVSVDSESLNGPHYSRRRISVFTDAGKYIDTWAYVDSVTMADDDDFEFVFISRPFHNWLLNHIIIDNVKPDYIASTPLKNMRIYSAARPGDDAILMTGEIIRLSLEQLSKLDSFFGLDPDTLEGEKYSRHYIDVLTDDGLDLVPSAYFGREEETAFYAQNE